MLKEANRKRRDKTDTGTCIDTETDTDTVAEIEKDRMVTEREIVSLSCFFSCFPLAFISSPSSGSNASNLTVGRLPCAPWCFTGHTVHATPPLPGRTTRCQSAPSTAPSASAAPHATAICTSPRNARHARAGSTAAVRCGASCTRRICRGRTANADTGSGELIGH